MAAGPPVPCPATGPPRDERGRDARARSEDRAVELCSRRKAVDSVEAEAVLIRSAHRLTPVRGRQYLTQFAAGGHWQVNAGGFWQVHPAAADALSEAVVGALEPKPGDTALDLYRRGQPVRGRACPAGRRGRVGHRDRVRRGRGQGRPGQPRRLPLGAGAQERRGAGGRRPRAAAGQAGRRRPAQGRACPRGGRLPDRRQRGRVVRLRLLRPGYPRSRPRPADRGWLAEWTGCGRSTRSR